GADRLYFLLLAVLLVQRPGGLVGDPGVGLVGQGHDFAHGAGEVALLVGLGNGRGGADEGVGQFRRRVGRDHHATVALVNEACAAAGDIDHLADQVGVDLLHEVFQVQVQVFHAPAQLGGVVVAQVFRRQVVQVGAGLDEG